MKKKGKKALKVIGIIIASILLLVALFFVYANLKPAVPRNYETSVKTGGDIEARYLAHGSYEVKYKEQTALQNYKKYEIYYPAELETSENKFPVTINKYSANVDTFFSFIQEYNGCPYQFFSDHRLIQMPLPGHLLMPFCRIESGRTISLCAADIYICFKSSDRHIYDFFYLICLCFDNIHPISPPFL